MTRTLCAAVLLVSACATDDAGPGPAGGGGGKADDPAHHASVGPIRFTTWQDAQIVARHFAVGNGAHMVGTYDAATFEARAVLDGIRARDAQTECDSRVYSTSRAD